MDTGIATVSNQYSLTNIIDGEKKAIKSHNTPYLNNQKASDCKEISSYKTSLPETNRQQVGGKGACLAMMDKLGMPVPKSRNITTTLVAKFEEQPIEVSTLKQFFSSRINKNKNQLEEFFSYFERSNTRGCNLISTLATIKSFFKEDTTQQKLYISLIEKFIKGEQFYNIVKNLPTASKIRAEYDDLINQLPANSPIIVRSSGVKEDSFGDAQAGKFESIIHQNKDIITTCLGVLASKYQPAVCQSIEPQGMALTLHHYIDCTAGGVVMSTSSLTDNNINIEFGPNHKELISGTLGKTPHRIIYHRNNQGNKAGDPVYDIIKTENLTYTEIQPETLKQLIQYTSRLEDIFNAPVDIEFGIDKNGQLYLFQVRPITKLSGGMNFVTTPPNNPIINGRLISEGICSGKMVSVNQQQDAKDIPQGAIIVAKAYQDWMLEPDFLNKIGGFIFEQGGDNDHVAITLRQADKPYMVAGDQFKSLQGSNYQDISLVCGSFNGTEGAYVVAGNELFQELSSVATVANSFAKCSSSANKTKIDTNFDRPDSGFQCLHELNHRLLEYFSANSWLSNCFSDKGCKALAIEKNRAEIIKQAKAEMKQMFADLDQFIIAYERFLNLGMKGDTKEIRAKLAEAIKLKAKAQTIKMQINKKINSIEAKLTTDGNLNTSAGSYEQYLQDCKDILTMTQKLTISKSVDQAASIQDIIIHIHTDFIDVFPIVAMNSGLGDTGILNRETNSQLINFATNKEQKIAIQNSIDTIKPLLSNYETKMITTNKATMVVAKLGTHACSIEMIEEAEGGKGRLLRLKFSDDFPNEGLRHYRGKVKRFWLLSQLLHHLNIDKKSAGMQISVCEATGILTVEIPQIKTKKAMQSGFAKLVEAVAYMRDLDLDLEKIQLNQPNRLWNFSLLQEKLRTLSSKENQDELFCLIFMLKFLPRYSLGDLGKLTDKKIQYLLQQIHKKDTIQTIADLESKFHDIPEIKENIPHYLLLNFPDKYVPLLHNSKYDWWLKDKSKVIELLSKSNILFQSIAYRWKNDKDVVLAAVKNDPMALDCANEKFNEDKDVILALVKNNRSQLAGVSKNFTKDRDIVLAAVQKNGFDLQYADKKFTNDKLIVLEAVKSNARALKYASDRLKNDREIVLEAVKSNAGALKYASDRLKNDREVVIAAVHQSGNALQFANDQYKNDKDIILAAVYQAGNALQYASDQLKNDREVVIAAVHQNGYALQYASDQLKNDKEIVLAAVHQDGRALQHVNYKFRDDKEIVLAAIYNNHSAEEYMSLKFKNDKDVMLAILKCAKGIDVKTSFNMCSTTLLNDVTFIIEALKTNIQISNYIPYSLKKDPRIIDFLEKSRVEFILKVDSLVELKPDPIIASSIGKPKLNINMESSTDDTVIEPVPAKKNVSVFKKIFSTLFKIIKFVLTIIPIMIVKLFTFIFNLFRAKSKKNALIEEENPLMV